MVYGEMTSVPTIKVFKSLWAAQSLSFTQSCKPTIHCMARGFSYTFTA